MQVVLDPLMHDRVAIAYTRKPDQPAGDEQSVAGIAIWATVSAEVDTKITEQVRAGVFPVRMASDDWTSGDMVWLLDVVAQDRAQATRVLTSFNQLSGDRPVKIHPIVARSVDPALLERMKAAPAGGEPEAVMPEPQGQA
jgi:cytolysin-activating lysine-acyltransferase